ncbi:MAG: hypothetical protein GF353_03320 [Candidatus Lokiarchaeota archaeon]|nr:hypothetical protein [Candidatus Lokiarchaeota archaeon]
MILLVTNRDDVTTDFIVNRLNKLQEPYYRLNTEDLVSNVGVNIDISCDKYILVDHQKNQIINLSSIKSVYYRRPGLPKFNNSSLPKSEIEFMSREIISLLEGIYKILNDRFWISPVYSIREAENKIHQLLVARELGFEIPRSLITTLKDNAIAFWHRAQGSCIVKPIKSGKVNDNRNPMVIFTSSISADDLEILNNVDVCPTYLQSQIDKLADIRVTVVGEQVFPAIIYSQDFPETVVDWRKGENVRLRHEKTKIPLNLERKCIELIKRLNLHFGAIDFILEKGNRFVFLEINPNGQWGWIEKRLGYDISGALVNLLLEGVRAYEQD